MYNINKYAVSHFMKLPVPRISVTYCTYCKKIIGTAHENFMPPGAPWIIHEAIGAVTMGANRLQRI